MSEFDAKSQLKEFPALTEAVRRLFQKPEFRGKVFYPYANVLCGYGSGGGPGTDFARELIAAGSKVVEERYVAEQPTEDAAWQYLNDAVRQVVLLYQAAIPDCAKHIILNLGYMSVPAESLDVNPGVDYKVFMDMQFNMVANDPAFKGLYGIMWYHSAYADEEILRWSVKLFRHYYIEGRRERLSRDPYILPHIQNGDFVDGTSGWTLAPAEEGSMDVKSWTGYGYLEGRYTAGAQGDTFLRTKRSAKGPNRFSQQLKKLEPGRLYSLKMFTADYQELLQGKSVKQRHQVGIDMKGVELVPDKSLQERCGSGIAGHTRGPFTRKNQLWLTYHRLVFRATSTEGTLTISDWASDKGPGGPIGRELIHNFVQFQPYLEE